MHSEKPRNKPRVSITAPAICGSILRLMGLQPSDDSYFDDVLELVSDDPGLTTRLLGIANSALLSGRESQAEINAALTRVGPSRFASIVIGGAVDELFDPATPELTALLEHSRGTATFARLLAQEYRAFGVDPCVAQSMGLLHNIGALLLTFNFPAEYGQILLRNNIDSRSILHAERDEFGLDHLEAGLQVADHWALPDSFRAVIADHHSSPSERETNALDRVALIRLSHRLQRAQVCGTRDQVEHAVALRALRHEGRQVGLDLDQPRIDKILHMALAQSFEDTGQPGGQRAAS